MIDLKDIAGLSEPLKRLIEVVAEGIGGLARPILIRKNADAKAYEIRTIAQAIADSQKLLGPVTYEDGSIVIESSSEHQLSVLPEATIEKRVLARLTYQEAKRQSNIERITQHAAEDLRTEQHVASESPDSDWITRFFRIAEDITTEQMQTLWGKVLAGEVKRPGSYSLRTLDLLKNINQREAETFVKVGRIAFLSADKTFVPNPDRGKYLEDKFGLTFLELLLLRELGLLFPDDLQFILKPAEANTQNVFACGSTCIMVERPKGTPKQSVTAIVFTEIGKQLLQLVDRSLADPCYIQKFASLFRREGVVIKSGLILKWHKDGIEAANLLEVPEDSPQKQKKEGS